MGQNRLSLGSKLICNLQNDEGFTVGKEYEVVDGGVDCYSNTELIVKNDSGKGFFIYGYTFKQAFKVD